MLEWLLLFVTGALCVCIYLLWKIADLLLKAAQAMMEIDDDDE